MKETYVSLEIVPKVWQINDVPQNVSMYLVEGEDKALLIDAGDSKGDLLKYIESLTDKPVELLVTHGHGDHAGRVDQFDIVYLSHVDIVMLQDWFDMNLNTSDVIDINGNEIIDLGSAKLEVVSVPGHTPGSVAVLDRDRELLFTSDCIGSGGLWMQLPTCTSLRDYYQTLCELEKKIDGLDKLRILVGHAGDLGSDYQLDYFRDVKYLTKQILEGKIVGEPTKDPEGFFGGYKTSYGKVNRMIYKIENIR